MARSSGIQNSFNGGELSPLLAGRTDTAKYAIGCERMSGFIPTIQGPAISAPGFRYVAEVKDSADRTGLVRFEFSTVESYMLEFGDLYIRFYSDRRVVESAPTVPYEIVSPYAAADLFDADGVFQIRKAPTGDVIYLFHADYPTYKLERFAATNWTITRVDFNPPPFKELNDTATTIYASAATGSVNLIASAATFTSAMVGQYVYLAEKSVRATTLWEAGKAVGAGVVRRSDGKNYTSLNAATTGGTKPAHTVGAAYDGDTGVQWEFADYGFGWAKITSFTNTTQVAATVVQQLPAGAVGIGNPTTRWALEAWNATDGYPTCGTFFRERLTAARGSTLWFTVTSDFENFATTVDGQTTADAGFDRTIASDRVNNIRWLSPGNVLLVGTAGDEWAVVEGNTTDAFGPENCRTKPQSTYGSGFVEPVRVGNETLFLQKAGRKMRAMAFRFEEDGFDSEDATVFAEHITKPSLIDLAYQQEPWSILWGARSDGMLVGLTWSRSQQVAGWFRRPFLGGIVEQVECIPAPDGSRDDLWAIVRYTIDGATQRYVCYMEQEADELTAQEDWFYVDMGLTYDGAPATTISGLDHLEGEEVWVLADGARHPLRTVASGSINLQRAASVVQVGLPNEGYLQPMELNPPGQDGTSQGKKKRVPEVVVRVVNSLGALAGPSEDKLQELRERDVSTPMGNAPAPFTGDIPIDWDGDYDRKQSIIIKRDKPMPVTVAAIMPTVNS